MATQTLSGNQENAANVIQEAWQETGEAVGDAVESVKHTASRAVEAVTETRDTIGEVFENMTDYVKREPWLLLGSAVFVGLAIGCLVGFSRR